MAENNPNFYRIEDDLTDSWVADWAAEGIIKAEAYLAKHIAFIAFLDEEPAEPEE